MNIIKATRQDAKKTAALLMRLWEGHTEEEMMECALEYIEAAEKTAFLALDGNEGAGVCLCSLRHDYVEGAEESPVGYLEGIYTGDAYRGQGVARALLSAAQQWAKEQGCREFASDCELENTQSLKFHLACGFQEANRIICFVKEIG